MGKDAGDVFPEYYVLRVNDFDTVARTPLDEWVKFLKTGEIDRTATAKGFPEAEGWGGWRCLNKECLLPGYGSFTLSKKRH